MSEQSKLPSKREWLKWIGIGCSAWFVLAVVISVLAMFHEPSPSPAEPVEAAILEATPAPVDTVTPPPPEPVAPEPMATPAPEVVPVAAPKHEKSVTVYTTRTGDHYHRSGCSSLRRSQNSTTLKEAQEMGYEPCRRCHPPQ